MKQAEPYGALKSWLVRCSSPERPISRCDLRAENTGLLQALQDLRILSLSQSPEQVCAFFADVRAAVQLKTGNRLDEDRYETD